MRGIDRKIANSHALDALNCVYRAMAQIGIAGQHDPSLIKFREPLSVWYEALRAKVKEEK